MKKHFTIKNVLITLGVIILDMAIYFVLAFLLINYDDFYDESKGEYWSLESMTFWQKVNYIGFITWQIINLIVIGYIIYRIIKDRKTTVIPSSDWESKD